MRIRGKFPHMDFSFKEGDKLISVDQWGAIEWESMQYMFRGCDNVEILAMDVPDLSRVTSMKGMFSEARAFNQDISGWDCEQCHGYVVDVLFCLCVRPVSCRVGCEQGDDDAFDAEFDPNLDRPTTTPRSRRGSALPGVQRDVSLGASSASYCQAEAARQSLISSYGWTIDDAGKSCP